MTTEVALFGKLLADPAPTPEAVELAIQEGVRLAMLEHLASNKTAATGAPTTPKVPQPPKAPPTLPNATPAAKNGTTTMQIAGSSLNGPTPSSSQQYLNFNLEGGGRKLTLRFYMNSPTQGAEWQQLLARFCLTAGKEGFSDTQELHGLTVPIVLPAANVFSLSGLASVGKALGL